jgi:hypothetical protein
VWKQHPGTHGPLIAAAALPAAIACVAGGCEAAAAALGGYSASGAVGSVVTTVGGYGFKEWAAWAALGGTTAPIFAEGTGLLGQLFNKDQRCPNSTSSKLIRSGTEGQL